MAKCPELSVIIPTLNEGENIAPLVRALSNALVSYDYELIFVDDSTDNTPYIIEDLAKENPDLRLLRPEQAEKSLTAACMLGFQHAQGEYVCTIDADLQHPPELIPALYKEAVKNKKDIVVASRYIENGSTVGLSPMRKWVSWTTCSLVRVLFAKTRQVKDPASGFFLFRKNILDGVDLNPRGFKILIELLVRATYTDVSEIPYTFLPRNYGKSKANLAQGLAFIKHLWLLRSATTSRS